MAERSLFFNSQLVDGKYDREYQAQDFATYFGSVLSSGLLHTDEAPGMKVSVESGTLNTVIDAGRAVLKGHLYINTTPKTLTHAIPEVDLDRIDRIVLRLDLRNSERKILSHIKPGTPATNPIPPELQRDEFIHEISLAQIKVRKNTVQLLPSDLIDERLDENLCGIVHSLISVPTTVFQQQFNTWFDDYKDSHGNDFQEWFDELQLILDENVAANLLNLINEHKSVNAIDAHLAKNIGLEDTSGNFAAKNIEGAMDELFTNVSDGKKLVGGAITDVDDRVVIPANPTFQQLAEAIGDLNLTEANITKLALDGVFGKLSYTDDNNLYFGGTTVISGSRVLVYNVVERKTGTLLKRVQVDYPYSNQNIDNYFRVVAHPKGFTFHSINSDYRGVWEYDAQGIMTFSNTSFIAKKSINKIEDNYVITDNNSSGNKNIDLYDSNLTFLSRVTTVTMDFFPQDVLIRHENGIFTISISEIEPNGFMGKIYKFSYSDGKRTSGILRFGENKFYRMLTLMALYEF